MKIKVLFVCIHNSARSQMAEAFLNHHASEIFQAQSAGLEPGKLNPLVVLAMSQMEIDLSQNTTNSVFDFLKEGRTYNYVITVCDESNSERCPIFPAVNERLHWNFKDPSAINGTKADKFKKTIEIRDEIYSKINEFVQKIKSEI